MDKPKGVAVVGGDEPMYGTADNPLKPDGTIIEIAQRVRKGQWTTLDLAAIADFILEPKAVAAGGEIATHELKIWPEFFAAVTEGRKTYEIRRNDRGFAVGNFILLREFDPNTGYSGNSCVVTVTYMTPGGQWGLPEDVCVLSIKLAASPVVEPAAKEGR